MQQENHLVLVAQLHYKDEEYEAMYREKLFKTRELFPFLQQSIITATDDGFMVKKTFEVLQEEWELPSPEDQIHINKDLLGKYALSTKNSELRKLDTSIQKYLQAALPGSAPVVIVGKPNFLDRIMTLVGIPTPENFWGRKEVSMMSVLIEKEGDELSFSYEQKLIY